jgi:hypothetical protein
MYQSIANFTVDTDSKSAREVAQEIAKVL